MRSSWLVQPDSFLNQGFKLPPLTHRCQVTKFDKSFNRNPADVAPSLLHHLPLVLPVFLFLFSLSLLLSLILTSRSRSLILSSCFPIFFLTSLAKIFCFSSFFFPGWIKICFSLLTTFYHHNNFHCHRMCTSLSSVTQSLTFHFFPTSFTFFLFLFHSLSFSDTRFPFLFYCPSFPKLILI